MQGTIPSSPMTRGLEGKSKKGNGKDLDLIPVKGYGGKLRYTIKSIDEPFGFDKGFYVFIRALQQLKNSNDGAIMVGLAGPSGSGKTAFSEKIRSFDSGVAVISMDMYNDGSKVVDDNFDDPRLTDYDLLLQNLADLRNGKSAKIPIYDFKTSTRVGYREQSVPENRIIILEGIYALSEKLRPLLDLRVSVTGGVHFDLVKRVMRDVRRSGQGPEEIIQQITDTVFPMYKAFIEPDLQTAQLKITNSFNPFSGLLSATYILKSGRVPSEAQVLEALAEHGPLHTQRRDVDVLDIYLLPPNEDPETCQSWLRMRNREGRYSLMFEEWVIEAPFVVSPRISFEVNVRVLGGLMALGYEIGTVIKRTSRVFSVSLPRAADDPPPAPCADSGTTSAPVAAAEDEGQLQIKLDSVEGLGDFVQIFSKGKDHALALGARLGLEGSYIAKSYIEQVQLEKLTSSMSAIREDWRRRFAPGMAGVAGGGVQGVGADRDSGSSSPSPLSSTSAASILSHLIHGRVLTATQLPPSLPLSMLLQARREQQLLLQKQQPQGQAGHPGAAGAMGGSLGGGMSGGLGSTVGSVNGGSMISLADGLGKNGGSIGVGGGSGGMRIPSSGSRGNLLAYGEGDGSAPDAMMMMSTSAPLSSPMPIPRPASRSGMRNGAFVEGSTSGGGGGPLAGAVNGAVVANGSGVGGGRPPTAGSSLLSRQLQASTTAVGSVGGARRSIPRDSGGTSFSAGFPLAPDALEPSDDLIGGSSGVPVVGAIASAAAARHKRISSASSSSLMPTSASASSCAASTAGPYNSIAVGEQAPGSPRIISVNEGSAHNRRSSGGGGNGTLDPMAMTFATMQLKRRTSSKAPGPDQLDINSTSEPSSALLASSRRRSIGMANNVDFMAASPTGAVTVDSANGDRAVHSTQAEHHQPAAATAAALKQQQASLSSIIERLEDVSSHRAILSEIAGTLRSLWQSVDDMVLAQQRPSAASATSGVSANVATASVVPVPDGLTSVAASGAAAEAVPTEEVVQVTVVQNDSSESSSSERDASDSVPIMFATATVVGHSASTSTSSSSAVDTSAVSADVDSKLAISPTNLSNASYVPTTSAVAAVASSSSSSSSAADVADDNKPNLQESNPLNRKPSIGSEVASLKHSAHLVALENDKASAGNAEHSVDVNRASRTLSPLGTDCETNVEASSSLAGPAKGVNAYQTNHSHQVTVSLSSLAVAWAANSLLAMGVGVVAGVFLSQRLRGAAP